MITYFDTSTLIKLIIDEDGSPQAVLLWQTADSVASARLVIVEARAALAAAHRRKRLSAKQLDAAKAALADFVEDVHLVEVTAELVDNAAQLAEDEALRGYDAIHLAAALVVGATLFTSADLVLCDAAGRQGLHVANPLMD